MASCSFPASKQFGLSFKQSEVASIPSSSCKLNIHSSCFSQGIAKRALQLFMAYAYSQLGVTLFRAKILESNNPSISLFMSLGYKETKRVAVFKEVYLEFKVDGYNTFALQESAKALVFKHYDPE
jgi:hypothetical protein